MLPHIALNWPAILVAVVAGFVFGSVWYTVLFGRTWAKLMGMDMSKKPDKNKMTQAMILQVVGLFLTSFVLAYLVPIWRPSVWGVATPDGPAWQYGLCGGVLVWAGFFVPMQLGKVGWEMRPWKLFIINTAHDFILIQVISQILSSWR